MPLRFMVLALLALLAAPVGAQDEDVTILAFGDSLTAGYELDEGLGFAPQLEDALRREGIAASVIDAGVSGDTSAAGRERIGWTLDGLDAMPDIAILELGGNDMLRALDPSVTEANLAAIIETMQERGIEVVLAPIPAAGNYGPEYGRAFDALFPRLATRYGLETIPFVPEGPREGLLLPDGVHPNFRGIKAIVSAFTPQLIAVLRN